MIYLAVSALYKDRSCKEMMTALRISYISDEEGVEKVLADIRDYNPSCQLLHVIEGGTRTDLSDIHEHFKDYRLVLDGLEGVNWWFEYNQGILDFFEVYNTLESIRRVVRK